MEGTARQLSIFAAEVAVDLSLSAILQINTFSAPPALTDLFRGTQSDKEWRSDARAALFITFPSKKRCFISHSASKTLTSVVSRLLFFLLMSDQSCSFYTMVSGLFTWLLHDGFPSSSWLSLPSDSCLLSVPTATLKLGFASGLTTLSTNVSRRNVHVRKGFMTVTSTRDFSDFILSFMANFTVLFCGQKPTTKQVSVGGRWSTRHRLRGVWPRWQVQVEVELDQSV